MKCFSVPVGVICGLLLMPCMQGAMAAGQGDITLKKPAEGALEISNIGDDSDAAEVLVENKDKTLPVAVDQPTPAVVRSEERGEAISRSEMRTARERSRGEPDESSATGASQGAAPVAGYAAGTAPVGAPTIGASQPSSYATVDAGAGAILPAPRPGTEMAVPSTVDTSSTGNQEKYRNLMVQEAATAAATGTPGAVENPAAIRRYLATDRASYQKRMGY